MELNSSQIQEILPHRYPLLLVDKITDFEPGKWAKGIKCVTANELQFIGHFPQMHIMPGVYLIEALAQTGAIAILSVKENKGKMAFLGGIKQARFLKQVIPGDVVDLSCEIIKQKGPIGLGKTQAKVNGELVVSAELIFAIQ